MSKSTDTKVVAIPEESLDGAGTWGVSEAVYNEAVASGNVVVNCDPTEEVFVPPECPPCIEDPNAIVPDWRFKEEGDVFLNGRTCEYCVTVNTGEIDATILNDESSREAFLEEQKIRGVDLILEFFEKTPLDTDSLNIVLDSALSKQFDVPVRPLLPIRVLVCVPVATIESIEFTPETEEEIVEAPVGPIGCVLEAPQVRTMVKRVAEAIRFYSHRYALWSHQTGQVIPNFDPMSEQKKLKSLIPALVQLMNRNGFKLNGKNAAEKIEFRFNENYELIYAQANERKCEPVELLWKKGGDNLGGFKELEPINDPRTMAYVSALVDMNADAGARDPVSWDKFFAKYTYPDINVYVEDILDPIGSPVMADGPLQQAAQSIVNDVVGLEDALVAKFSEQVCRDRAGQKTLDADIRDFDDMLRAAIYAKGKNIQVGDDTFLNLPELLGDSSNLEELYNNIINKLGVCGLLDLLSTAFACLSKGVSLADSLSIIVKAALKAMDPGNLEKLFIGLPHEKQLEIKQKIAAAGWGDIPAPWEAGYRPGSYNYNVELDPDTGAPVGEEHTISNPYYDPLVDPSDPVYGSPVITVLPEEDTRSIAERTAQYRIEAQGTIPLGVSGTSAQFGGGGSVGTAAANSIDAILEAYIEAILDSVDADYLLEQLGKFPGAELVTKILMNKDCPPPPLFNPPLNEFMKTLELDFCRNHYDITWPKMRKFEIPDFFKMFMEAILEVLMQLAVKIIITILEMILKILLNGFCNLLGLIGDLVGGLFDAEQPSNQFADSLKNSLQDTGLSSLGIPVPLADDETINQSAADLFASFSRSCTSPEDLPSAQQASDFLTEMGLILTQGEFVDVVEGVAADAVYVAIYQLVLTRHQSFLCIFPNISAIKDFFKSLGAMVDPSFLDRGTPHKPVMPSICSDDTGQEEANRLRSILLERKGLNPDLIDELIESLKCRALSDMEDLANIAQNGLFANIPPLIDTPGCDVPGLIPRDPTPESLPRGPVDMLSRPGGVFHTMFSILDAAYYEDLVGRGGFLNMVLSDREGRSLRSHHTFVAVQSIFGVFGTGPQTHQDLLPDSVAKYLKWVLEHPGEGMVNGAKYMEQTFTPGAAPDLKLKYSNYFSGSDSDYYRFVLNFTASDYNSQVLNNNYRIVLDETFNYDEPATDLTSSPPSTTFSTEVGTERLVIDTDPGLPEGVKDLIETELGLEIEPTLVSGNSMAGPEQLSAQAVVFGKYIEKILRDNLSQEVLSTGPDVETNLSFISDACSTEIFNYVNTGFFNFLAGTIAENNMAFEYGEGGSNYDKNEPITYFPTKINLDGSHIHPGPGNPDTGSEAGAPIPLDPLAFGGNEDHPAFYMQPPRNRPGWCGIMDKMLPEVDACDPKRENIIGFKQISDHASEFYQQILDDERLSTPSTCAIEEPCNKILDRSAAAMIEGNLKATVRIYAAEVFLKGAPAFTKFKADLKGLYGDPMTAYITQTLKDGFYRYSKKGFGRRKSDEYYYQFLEQCVQNFGRKVDAGLVEITSEEQEALDIINSLQTIWSKDTVPSSGKLYANTGERLKRVLAPGFFGAQLKNVFNPNYNVPLNDEDGALSKKAAEKLKEESWDYFMREIEPQAEVILKRYVAEELKHVSDEFANRIPPEYRTLYEIFLGHETFSCFGNLNFSAASEPDAKPNDDGHPFSVASSMVESGFIDYYAGVPLSANTGEVQQFLGEMKVGEANRPNPASTHCQPPGAVFGIDNARYWPFVLEQFIEIEDYDSTNWESSSSGPPEIWESVVMGRPSNLFGIVRASELNEYLQANAADLSGFTRSDLWKSWKYGLRIIFVPPNESGTTFTIDAGPSSKSFTYSEESPGTSQAMPNAVNIKYKILGIAAGATPGSETFTKETIQNNKAFWFDGAAVDVSSIPASIPLAKGNLSIPMDIDCLNTDWLTSYDSAGGFAPLVQNLVCSPEYQMLFRYCFNMPRILSVIGIYIIKSFLPSIGKASDEDTPQKQFSFSAGPLLSDGDLSPSPLTSEGEDNDGWYKPSSIFSTGTYRGGGLSLFSTALNFKRWNFHKSFHKTKKLVAQSFMDLYNSQDPSYTSEALNDPENEKEKNTGLNVTWPKFSIRFWQKEVDRPYDMFGDLCFNPEDDYSD